VRELVVISGKGGTGKTSLLASFAVLSGQAVVADCDVDAADLHLVLAPKLLQREELKGGYEAVVRAELCRGCGRCLEVCRFEAVREAAAGETAYRIDPLACEGCGVCARECPEEAIELREKTCGEWFVSETLWGPLVHARLGVAGENSGKLVTAVRRQARSIAESSGRQLILADGPPGIGCPVIASLAGATAVLVVTEPTPAGQHDLERVLALCRHFQVPAAVCVNKWDLNREVTERVEAAASGAGATSLGRVPYDPAVTAAQLQGRAVVQLGGSAARAITAVWEKLGALELPGS
jgi:MinD superfamily P-loop ATPase